MPICQICSKTFSAQNSLNRHMRNVHKQLEKNIVSHNFERFDNKCLEQDCNTSYRFTSELRAHLQLVHNMRIDKEVTHFKTIEDFNAWFQELCENNNLQYVRHKQHKMNVIYFSCNRSGKYEPISGKRKRLSKTQGTCKIGRRCTSQIILVLLENIEYCATYYKTHYGHTLEIQHVRIPKQIRNDVALRLTSGLSVSRVLDSYRSNLMKDNRTRSSFITRKDINNIKASYHINVQDDVRHENDCINVNLLTNECQRSANEILLYNEQDHEFPSLNADDFCVAFISKPQDNISKNVGNRKVDNYSLKDKIKEEISKMNYNSNSYINTTSSQGLSHILRTLQNTNNLLAINNSD